MANEAEESGQQGRLHPQNDLSDAPGVVVIGSINMDMVMRAAFIPAAGQTFAGHSFSTIPGGKGANQALAAARCGARVSIIGCIGNDDFGQRLVMGLKANGIDTSAVMVCEGVSTGVATVIVNDIGENAICVAGGANLQLRPEHIEEQAILLDRADLVLMQLEVPQDTVVYALRQAQLRGIPVVLNPAPVGPTINPALFNADVLIPNQDETARLCGEPVHDAHSAKLAGSALVGRGAKIVVVTLGRRGALAITPDHILQIPPFSAKVVDTTGAGDAFCGAFAVAYARERLLHNTTPPTCLPQEALKNATRFAAAAGSLACGKFGAQPSMPHLRAIQRLLQRSC